VAARLKKKYDVVTQSTQRSPRILWVFLCGLCGLGVDVVFFTGYKTGPYARMTSGGSSVSERITGTPDSANSRSRG